MRVAILAVMLSGCASTAHLDQSAPAGVYHSSRSRSAVVDCLLDRLGGSGMRPERSDSGGITTLRITSLDQWTNPALYLFTVSDAGSGSTIEARIPQGFVKRGLPTAKTCF